MSLTLNDLMLTDEEMMAVIAATVEREDYPRRGEERAIAQAAVAKALWGLSEQMIDPLAYNTLQDALEAAGIQRLVAKGLVGD